ncbi:WD40 repeat domain-containing protein [Candidatus Symbiobacter mobilis]|uniref:WD40 repeat domain-containing protein n=1 Tax=Candidatus Symbiobacter mobilis TaxID=1436290 RepID=UPI0016519FE4|nr:WD40 repeat domain-containing protein [Candidatus Symbiobacter mobilis]
MIAQTHDDQVDQILDGKFTAPPTDYGKGLVLVLPQVLQDSAGRYAGDCYGRDWLRTKISDFVRHNVQGYVIIAADAIWGKTHFALDWYRNTLKRDSDKPLASSELPPLSGWAFIRKEAVPIYSNPVDILLWLEAQTRNQRDMPYSDQRPAPGQATIGDFKSFNADGPKKLAEHFYNFLVELGGHAQTKGDQAILLLDGVDEIWGSSGTHPSSLFPGALPLMLPKGVFIVLLSRPGKHLRWKSGDPQSPCLTLDLASAFKPGAADDGQLDLLRQGNQKDLESYLEGRLEKMRNDGLVKLDEWQKLNRDLLDAAQGYLIVLITLLANDINLADRLEAWRNNPKSLPRGPKELFAGVLIRILEHLRVEANRNGLDDTCCNCQVITSLGLAASLRQPMTMKGLGLLLFPNKKPVAQSALSCPIALSCPMTADACKAALDYCAEVFVGQHAGDHGVVLAFWHPLMRDIAIAAFRALWSHQDINVANIVAALGQDATTTLQPLHRWLAMCSQRFWKGGHVDEDKRAACAYALAWGPWHGLHSGNQEVSGQSINTLQDPVYLQTVYSRFGNQAGRILDPTVAEALGHPDNTHPQLLGWVQRALVHHDRALAEGELAVASVLYNDLCGSDAIDAQWRQTVHELALAAGPVRWAPGSPPQMLKFKFQEYVTSIAFSPDARWLAVATGKDIVLLEAQGDAFRETTRLQGHSNWVNYVVFSGKRTEGGFWLASASSDGVGLWSVPATGDVGGPMILLKGHTGRVNHVAFSGERADGGFWLASASSDGNVGLWSVPATGGVSGPMIPLEGHTDGVNHVAFSEKRVDNGFWLASSSGNLNLGMWTGTSGDPNVGLWSVPATGGVSDPMIQLEGHTGWVNHVAFSEKRADNSFWLASASDDGNVGLWSVPATDDGVSGPMIQLEGRRSRHMAFSGKRAEGGFWLASASGFWLASASSDDGFDDKVGLWSVAATDGVSGQMILLGGHTDDVNHVAFSGERAEGGFWLASASSDGNVGLWSVPATGDVGGPMMRLEGHINVVGNLAFSGERAEGGYWLASADLHNVCLWSVEGSGGVSDLKIQFDGHTDTVNHVAFSGERAEGGYWLASASKDHNVCLWSVEGSGGVSGQMIQLEGHSDRVHYVAFSGKRTEGGFWLASACLDGNVGLWSVPATGDVGGSMILLKRNPESVIHVAFSGERAEGGFWLASASSYGNAGLWSVAPEVGVSGPMIPLKGHHTEGAKHVAFSENRTEGGFWLASASRDGNVRLWSVPATGDVGGLMMLLKGHTESVKHVAFSGVRADNGFWLASASSDDNVGLWSVAPEVGVSGPMIPLKGHTKGVQHVAFSGKRTDGGFWLASASDDHSVGLWSVAPEVGVRDPMSRLQGHTESVNRVAFCGERANGNPVLVSASDREIIFWRIPDGLLLARVSFSADAIQIMSLRWSTDQQMLLVAGVLGTRAVNLSLIVPEWLLSGEHSAP